MGHRGITLLGPLLILATFCHFGSSLECFSCISVGSTCSERTNCSFPFNACLYAKADSRNYYHCWKMTDCTYQFISVALGEPNLTYNCCQKQLCNGHPGPALLGKPVLLVAALLVTAWHLCL